MYSGKLSLTNPSGTPYSLSNEFTDQYLFSEAVRECNSAQELLAVANQYKRYRYNLIIDTDIPAYTRISFKDTLGNVFYLIAYREKPNNRLSTVSDEDLIAELESRGYQIM